MALATKVGGFDVLCSNIELDNFDEMEKSSKSIAKKLNSVYYDLDNDDTSHLYIVGSVGRKTAIKGSSDLDILFDLPYDIYWKVRNVGPVAESKNCIRGQIEKTNLHTHREHTDFQGSHYVECYLVKNNICVARAHISVPIGVA